jgi:hypothetical protein
MIVTCNCISHASGVGEARESGKSLAHAGRNKAARRINQPFLMVTASAGCSSPVPLEAWNLFGAASGVPNLILPVGYRGYILEKWLQRGYYKHEKGILQNNTTIKNQSAL